MNLKSAFAFSALTSNQGELEQEFYENIVEIPHYESKYLRLLDREDSIKVVAQNFEKFQNLYKPIHQEYFKDIVSFENGKFQVDQSEKARIHLMSMINDNVYQNMSGMSTQHYDKDLVKVRKQPASVEKKQEIATHFVKTHKMAEQKELMHKSIDKILLAQRNTKFFLISMTGPFFLFIKVVEYVIKYGILIWMWYKKKNAPKPEEKEEGKEEPKAETT